MPRVKIPRKSTWVDMTAFVDVAFLILAFFILTTKAKPEEPVPITTPSSVSSTKVDAKKSLTIMISKEGLVYLVFPEDKEKKRIIIDNVNKTRQMGLSENEIEKFVKMGILGSSFDELKPYLSGQLKKQNGIPTDSIGGELSLWVRDVLSQYAGDEKFEVFIRGDAKTKYPSFGNVLEAMKNNKRFDFMLITDPEVVPQDSELYSKQQENR